MKTMFSKTQIAITAVLLTVMGTALATADLPCERKETTGIHVDDSDLDLKAYSGMFRLYQRLQDAAMASCDPSGQRKILPIVGLADSGDCYSTTLQSALDVYDSLFLNNIHWKVLEAPILVGFGDDL